MLSKTQISAHPAPAGPHGWKTNELLLKEEQLRQKAGVAALDQDLASVGRRS